MSVRTLDLPVGNPFKRSVGAPKNLAWPVSVFRVTLPRMGANRSVELNAFESVILGLLQVSGPIGENLLAERTCLPNDMVRLVVARLQDRGYVDRDGRIKGTAQPVGQDSSTKESTAMAMVFRERVSGQLLPHLLLIRDGDVLRTKLVDRPRILPSDVIKQGAPTSRDILRVVQIARRRSAQFSQDSRLPTLQQIRVSPESEEFYLHCQIALQAHDGEFRIADPFGLGFSKTLEDVFDEQVAHDENLHNWLLKWRESTVAGRIREPRLNQSQSGFLECQHLFPELVSQLRGDSHGRRDLRQLYAAIEWALFYCCEMNGLSTAISQLKLRSLAARSAWLVRIASSLGLQVPERGFRDFPEGRLLDLEARKVSMDPILAVALVQAEMGSEHPLRRVAIAHPDFLQQLQRLGRSRGDDVHGKAKLRQLTDDLASDSFMQSVVSTLLPSIRFIDSLDSDTLVAQADELIQARTNLQANLGYQAMRRLGRSTETSLINAERDLISIRDGDDAQGLISNLCSAIQSALRGLMLGQAQSTVSSGFYEIAEANLVGANLGSLPKSLKSVNLQRISSALQGRDSTLGSLTVAFLVSSEVVLLEELAVLCPRFLGVVSQLLDLRGHGNKTIEADLKVIKPLHREAVMVVGALLELTDWK
jgi:hypothetical protein